MYHECRHIFPSGLRCHSPALHNKPFCYYHANLRRAAKTAAGDPSLHFPVLEDKRSIQTAVSQVLNALAAGRIDPRHARLLLYGLQIAAQVTPPVKGIFISTVRSVHEEGDDLLAPEEPVCEPPEDCRNCPKRDHCDDFEESEDDDEGEGEGEGGSDNSEEGEEEEPAPSQNQLLHQVFGCRDDDPPTTPGAPSMPGAGCPIQVAASSRLGWDTTEPRQPHGCQT